MAKKKPVKKTEEVVVEPEAEAEDWNDYMTPKQRKRYEGQKAEMEKMALDRHVKNMEEYRDINQELGPFLDRLKSLKKEIVGYVRETGELTMIQGSHIEIRAGYTKVVPDKDALVADAKDNPDLRQYFKQQPVRPGISIKVDGA